MAAPTLVIGVGGTGVRVLLRVKERFLEAYDEVPKDIILYEIDTDDYRDTRRNESFNGVKLTVEGERVGNRIVGDDTAEFLHVATDNKDETLDAVHILKRNGAPEWQWVNEDRLDKTLVNHASRIISTGAGTVRPVGRSALFLKYGEVYSQIQSRLNRIAGRQREILQAGGLDGDDANIQETQKATVFVVASVAGGSGAGMVIDILRMIEHMRNQDALRAAPISVYVMLVGGASFTDEKGERTESNTLAALRELDRLGAIAGRALNKAVPPVMTAPAPIGRFASRLGPAEMILLFDKPDRTGNDRRPPRNAKNGYLDWVVVPSIADLIMAFADERIAPEFRTVRVDLDQNRQRTDPYTNQPGYFPYVSAGIHSLIFPERDVRRSAGLRLLLELWNDYLVRNERVAMGAGNDLPPVTRELWGEDRPPSAAPLTPYIFADEGFQRLNICSGAANNNFVQMVVTSSVNDSIKLPSARKWFGLFGGKSMVGRVLALVGLPNSAKEGVDMERMAQALERQLDRSIEELGRQRNYRDVRTWREDHFGHGQLGNEKDGLWIEWMHSADSVHGHDADFYDVLQQVVLAILNDKDPQARRLPYRLEYAQRVLERLEQHILRLKEGDPRDTSRGALLSDYFQRQIANEERARQRVNDLEGPATRNERFAQYLAANQEYARAKKELIGKQLLELLCDLLLRELSRLRAILIHWQDFLRKAGRIIGEAQTTHERNRIDKARIPVRTYVIDRPEGKDFKDGQFEQDLYERHRQAAVDGFLKHTRWQWIGNQFELEAPFGFDRDKRQNLSVDESILADRAITWACTKKGNLDNPASIPPLRDLASPAEVSMSVRVRDYFSSGDATRLANLLTKNDYLASLCPLERWPRSRLLYALGLPRTAPAEDGVADFYNDVVAAIDNATRPPNFIARTLRVFDPENQRHAVAAEFAVGFKLSHRTDYQAYIRTYRRDTDRLFALHCMPEEDQASTYYELEFREDSNVYPGKNLTPMLLDPAVVDILGNRERLEMFVKALAISFIGQLAADLRQAEGADFYLWPQAPKTQRIRLSKMHTVGEINTIAQDLTPLATELTTVTQNRTMMNRLRLMYALRTFMLLEHDVDNSEREIKYADVYRRVDAQIERLSIEQRVAAYKEWCVRFLQYYEEYKNDQTTLAHLGLVLGRVAHDLSEANKIQQEDRED